MNFLFCPLKYVIDIDLLGHQILPYYKDIPYFS